MARNIIKFPPKKQNFRKRIRRPKIVITCLDTPGDALMDVQKGFYADDVHLIIIDLMTFLIGLMSGKFTQPLPAGVKPLFIQPFIDIEFDRKWDSTIKTGGIHTEDDATKLFRAIQAVIAELKTYQE